MTEYYECESDCVYICLQDDVSLRGAESEDPAMTPPDLPEPPVSPCHHVVLSHGMHGMFLNLHAAC